MKLPFPMKMGVICVCPNGVHLRTDHLTQIYWAAWQMSNIFFGALPEKNKKKHENLLPFVPTAENISRPLMWRARALGHRANNLTAVNAAFWHLCIWLRAADSTRLATTQVNVFYRSCSTVGRNWQSRNHRREKIRNGNCASACDHQISFKSEIWFIRSNILINLARRMERVPNSFGSTSHVHLVRSPLRSDWSVLPNQCQRRFPSATSPEKRF